MLCYRPAIKSAARITRANRGHGSAMTASSTRKAVLAAVGAAALLAAVPAAAQFSQSYNFLKAVKDRDGDKATTALSIPGTTIINTRGSDGDGALHIVVKRRDATWLGFLLSKGADPNMKDQNGNTPLIDAAQIGYEEGVRILIVASAQVNLANGRGETALIYAVHNRDVALTRLLLANGANPRQADRITGKSARDYAAEDPRATAIARLIDETIPAKPKGPVQGPRLN